MSAFQQQHFRSESSSTSTTSYGSTGSAYQLILDHILTYPGSYEIPLRTMYTLNCAPRAQPVHPGNKSPSSVASSPISQQGQWHDSPTTLTFTENLMAQISKLPNQPTSLPPSFITSFVQRCFPPELIDVDFPQALTGLDYLKDLETRRRREVAAAMSRLAIDRTTLELDDASLGDRYPGVQQWVMSINEKERKVDALYTQVYVSLRRWILVNEMSLQPFSKVNCVAMLNTLYPPTVPAPLTSTLTSAVLKDQRDGFFKYIVNVEQKGPRILTNLMNQGKVLGEENGWAAAVRTLGKYLQLANSIIVECCEITDVQHLSSQTPRDSGTSKTPRKVDSGVSFNASEPLPSEPHVITETMVPVEPHSRPKTPSGQRYGTPLEMLARGLKTIGRSRNNAKGLRKMRSLGALSDRKAQISSPSAPDFDVDAMRLQRMRYEASTAASHTPRRQHHEI
ncbi:hypothetical protein BAUCODRAFT_123171 [Baudoinia panamericana UAMH 10762]|uniref:Uncharacterized protein n=1 Tax=Baudoinia panamericana (strain UAMH 10762) TaxID=717646 RepID=M2NAK4_BAUPA|nr:uncharacterized protein BAUCODRAFT_123171 [Baudoinia panamericana UAMH 10762]EMC95880.1 hypothetical protein BAUCODRAFT_123171 [Baudoinia panamericana UAMH 10762]